MAFTISNSAVSIHPTAFVAPGAVLIGDVSIGAESSAWYGTILRGDIAAIRVGARTNIQDGCILHGEEDVPVVIGDGVSLGHAAIVHGATIGNNTLVSIRATVLSRCVVGENCIIGAGAVVAEGTIVPPNSLVLGVPGRIVKAVTAEQSARIRMTADNYVGYRALYLQNPEMR